MTMYEYLKGFCLRKGITIHKLEMDLGFSNGSLSKANAIPLERAASIAEYFGVTLEQLWNKEYPEDTYDPVSGYPIYPEDDTPARDSFQAKDAKRLYELYTQAPPEIRLAVETLLKSQLRDS